MGPHKVFDPSPWKGKWVALKDGVVVESAPSFNELDELVGKRDDVIFHWVAP